MVCNYEDEKYNELHPPRGIQGHGMQKSIDILVKLYDCYKDVATYDDRLKEQKENEKSCRDQLIISGDIGKRRECNNGGLATYL